MRMMVSIPILAAVALPTTPCHTQEADSGLSEVDRYNYVLGTQTIGAAYKFTDDSRLVETAEAILEMGSNVLKLSMGKGYSGAKGNVGEAAPGVDSLVKLARDEPSHRRVLDMPFAHYIIWAYPFQAGWWSEGFSEEDQETEYREMYDLARWLLETYSGSGKAFYLGHWEGDWHLRSGYNAKDDSVVKPEAVQGMVDWLNTRQRAVDDAKRDTPHEDVWVYNYVEVNLVKIAMEGRPSVTNDVLPKTNIDFVSYSSWDSSVDVIPALDYIESKLAPKAGITGKRVFLGEYGFPAIRHSPEEQAELSRRVMRAGLEWGCPFVLYWEFYNNEVTEDGTQRGFWMVDDRGVKQPVYDLHQRYYAWARGYVSEFRAEHGRVPTDGEFREAAVKALDEL